MLINFIGITQCRTVADDTGAKQSFLFKKDENLFNYNSVDAVRVYVTTESRYRAPTYHHVYVDVYAGEKTHTFVSEGFNRDHKNILDFLKNFDSEIITADPTDKEEVLVSSDEQQGLLDQIFDQYS